MRYERPAIERRIPLKALMVIFDSGTAGTP
jgi:hypothetical protein